jgi:hypothetical protein
MIQFVIVVAIASGLGWLGGLAYEAHPLLIVPLVVALFWAGWHLQTFEEKEATKKWWYDRL